jgi:hypothetical protein
MATEYHHPLNKDQQHKEETGYQNRLIPVAWAILVMGLSLVLSYFCMFGLDI